MELSFPLYAGIVAAILHVIFGPDHLVAVAPFAIEREKKAWKIGLFWGIGHLLGMLSIGVLFLAFKDLIPINKISKHSEQLVGVVLIALGIWVLITIFRDQKKHKNIQIYNKDNQAVKPEINKQNTDSTYQKRPKSEKGMMASISIGFIHGLAGIAHFLLFLPIIGFESKIDSIKYIIGFALGILIAMVSFAFVVGKVSDFSKKSQSELFFKGLRLASGLFAFVIGIYWTLANSW